MFLDYSYCTHICAFRTIFFSLVNKCFFFFESCFNFLEFDNYDNASLIF